MNNANTIVRIANQCDAPALKAIDSVVKITSSRSLLIDKWLLNDQVLVAEYDDMMVGYIALSYTFFNHGIVDMLMIHVDYRGRKFGEHLMRHIEQICISDKLFVPTNHSNFRMQRLLVRLGYRLCGYISELDPGDPELIFVKNIKSSQ